MEGETPSLQRVRALKVLEHGFPQAGFDLATSHGVLGSVGIRSSKCQ